MLSLRFQATCLVVLAATASNALAEKHIAIISENRAGKDWQLSGTEILPAYPPGVEAGDVCVNIGYFVDENGVPSQFAHLKSWSGGKDKPSLDVFEQSAVAVLQERRFMPVDAAHTQPIYTSQTFAFSNTKGADLERVGRHCAIRDLERYIAVQMEHADMGSWYQIRWNEEWFKAKNTRIHGLNRE